MSEKTERSLEDYEADNARRVVDGYRQPDPPTAPPQPAAKPAVVDEKKAV